MNLISRVDQPLAVLLTVIMQAAKIHALLQAGILILPCTCGKVDILDFLTVPIELAGLHR